MTKQIRAFRNNYPAAILLTILILFSAASQAQLRDGLYHTPITPAYSWKSGWFKTNLSIPTVLATSGIDTGSVYYRLTDSSVQVYTGSQWLTIGSGGGGTWGSITGTLSAQTDLQNALNAKVDTARTLTINGVTYSLGANRTWSLDLQSVTDIGSYTTRNIRSSLGFYVRNSTNTQTLIALDNNSDSHGELVISNGPSTIYSRLRHDYLTFSNSGFTHKIKPPSTITNDVTFTLPNTVINRTIPTTFKINSTTVAANDTGLVDLGTISSATVLNNVGTGYDVAVQGTDGVKRLQGDWGITLDSATSNVVKIKADSSEVASKYSVDQILFNDTLTQTLTDASTVTFNAANGKSARVTITATRTLAFSNFHNGMFLSLLVIQDGTGGWGLNLPASTRVINGGSGAVTLTTAASSQDILTFWKINDIVYCNYGKNYN